MCHNELRLTPRRDARQQPRRTQLRVDPTPSALVPLARLLREPGPLHDAAGAASPAHHHGQERRQRRGRAPAGCDTRRGRSIRDRARTERDPTVLDAYQFVFESPHVVVDDAVLEYARPSFVADRPVLEAVRDLTRRIHLEFRYDKTATTVATPVADVLRQRRGVCQDFAHLEIACLRALGLPARYVSGYILTVPPPGSPRLIGADASHAWLAVWVGDAGWVDVDPTNNQLPGDQHITVAWGRDYADVSPLRGVVLGGGEHRVGVAVDVTPLD